MGSRYRQPPSDLIRSQLDITNRLETLENTPRSPTTSVDSGAWKFIASNGVEVVMFGEEGVSGNAGVGWVFRRGENNSLAFYLGGNQVSNNQYWAFNDNSDNIILSDDAQSAQGLARPYIPYTATKYSDITGSGVTTTSTSFVPAYLIIGKKQHPRMEVQYIINTPAGVSAQVQLVDTTTGNPATQIIIEGPDTYGGSTFSFMTVSADLAGSHMNYFTVDIQIRVSAGAGTVGISHIYSYGVQS